ncbi:hypothetical protein, partial [Mesorhizobium sp.]|uniref:hypothetical protein n=1 Tax=Mesorhizobium sp. TaxID=1871066 RepID=UPI0025F58E40
MILAARLAKSIEPYGYTPGSHPVSYRPEPGRLPAARDNGRNGSNDTPVQPVLCDKIRQHYCPKFLWQKSGDHTRPIHKKLGRDATQNFGTSTGNASFDPGLSR